MKVVIIEDERHSAEWLKKLLGEIDPLIEVLEIIGTVEHARKWFSENQLPDLVFLDIHLSDGLGFDIFEVQGPDVPTIFTTAFDQYTLRAFKVNSIDYILKPIEANELKNAVNKFKSLTKNFTVAREILDTLKKELRASKEKRFLSRASSQLIYIKESEVAGFISENGTIKAITFNGKKHILDLSLDQLEKQLDVNHFFRASRTCLVQKDAIKKASAYFNGRFILDTAPAFGQDIIISKEKMPYFRKWMEGTEL